MDGSCSWNSTLSLQYNFGPVVMTNKLAYLAKKCAAITNPATCSSWGMVHVDPTVTAGILGFDLVKINTPVNATECVVWSPGDSF